MMENGALMYDTLDLASLGIVEKVVGGKGPGGSPLERCADGFDTRQQGQSNNPDLGASVTCVATCSLEEGSRG